MAKRKKVRMTRRNGKNIKKVTIKTRGSKNKVIACFMCRTSVEVDKTVHAILCGGCTARATGSPTEIGKKPKAAVVVVVTKGKKKGNRGMKPGCKKGTKCVKIKGASRGWHLKKLYKHTDGKTYSFGQLTR